MTGFREDTICAIATPYAVGSIGIIRISGERSKEIVSKIFLPKGKRGVFDVAGFSGIYGNIIDNKTNEIIDDVIVFVYNSPKSYTGEEVCEISCHGGLYILKRVLRLCVENGARLAEGGEFTKRAFLNGKLSLTQAEAVMDVISASGEQSSRAARSAREGSTFRAVSEIKSILLSADASLAVWADYPEEDIGEVSPDELLEKLENARAKAKKLLDGYDTARIIKNGVDTVIVGKPNVGKSTLMNMLSGSEKSIVTEIAGTTRDVVEEVITLDGVVLNLADTAGLRETDDPVERLGVSLANKKLEGSYLVLAVFDGSRRLEQEDEELISKLDGRNCVAIINKSDLPQILEEDKIREKISHIVYTTAKENSGKEELISCVREILSLKDAEFSSGVIANERQRSCIVNALESIDEAVDGLNMGMSYDAVNISIDYALESLMELTGERVSEAVVDEVFSKFCVGK